MPPDESGASMLAYTRRGFAGEIATPILPSGFFGMPALKVISRQVSPPSVVFHRPLRPPPELMPHGMRWNFHIDANRMRGFVGSIVRSIAPVESLRKRIFSQLFPPSLVR